MLNNEELVRAVKEAASRAADAATLLSETVAMLRRERRHYNWVGVYLLRGDTLVLGPYAGKPTPHTRIPLNQGTCGAAAFTPEDKALLEAVALILAGKLP